MCVLSAKEGRKLAPKDGLLHALLQKGKTLESFWYYCGTVMTTGERGSTFGGLLVSEAPQEEDFGVGGRRRDLRSFCARGGDPTTTTTRTQQRAGPSGFAEENRNRQADVEFARNFLALDAGMAAVPGEGGDVCADKRRHKAGRPEGGDLNDDDDVYIASLGCHRPYPTRHDLYFSDKSDSDTFMPAPSALSEAPREKRRRLEREVEQQQQHGVKAGLEILSDELLHKIACHLDPSSLSALRQTSWHFKNLVDREDGSAWRSAMRNYCGASTADHLVRTRLPGGGGATEHRELARKLVTLDDMRWTRREVGGAVEPSRCNFSSCAVGTKILIFGGDHGQHALNDTYVLDLSRAEGEGGARWERLFCRNPPPGRFGHTLRKVNDHTCVLFGGCGNAGLFNDCYLLDLDEPRPEWKLVRVDQSAPAERVWHAACVVQESKLVVFGGCDKVGKLLDDVQVLDLSPLLPGMEGRQGAAPPRPRGADHAAGGGMDWASIAMPPHRACKSKEGKGGAQVALVDQVDRPSPSQQQQQQQQPSAAPREVGGASLPLRWRRLDAASRGGFRVPARIGHSLVLLREDSTEVVCFGGIANAGPVRARDNSSFVMDVCAPEPKWTKLNFASSSTRRGEGEAEVQTGGAPGGSGRSRLPSPRLDHVCWNLPGDRQVVFGGSPSALEPAGGAQDGVSRPNPGRGGADNSQHQHQDPHCSVAGAEEVEVSRHRPDMFLLNTRRPGSAEAVSSSHSPSSSWSSCPTEGAGPLQATWTRVQMQTGAGRQSGPQSAWAHCACVMEHGTKCVVLGGSKGQDWLVNQLHELSIM